MPKPRSGLSNTALRTSASVRSASPLDTPGEVMDSTSAIAVARAVEGAVSAVPGVHRMSPGRFVEAATYGARTRVLGVVVGGRGDFAVVAVHIVAVYAPDRSLIDLADKVRRAVIRAAAAITQVGRIDVAVDDLWTGEGETR